jgi:hypothetical protein
MPAYSELQNPENLRRICVSVTLAGLSCISAHLVSYVTLLICVV